MTVQYCISNLALPQLVRKLGLHIQAFPSFPSFPAFPTIARLPTIQAFPSFPSFPAFPTIARLPTIQAFPSFPSLPSFPSFPPSLGLTSPILYIYRFSKRWEILGKVWNS